MLVQVKFTLFDVLADTDGGNGNNYYNDDDDDDVSTSTVPKLMKYCIVSAGIKLIV